MYFLNESSFRALFGKWKQQITHLFNNFIVSSRQHKNEERLGHSFFNYIKTKWSAWVWYSLKAALNYSSLDRSMYFWCHDTNLKKILSTETFNLTWSKQANFNSLDPLPRVFQIVLRNMKDGKFVWGGFFYRVVEIWQGVILPLKPFSKLKTTFSKYWTLINIKISMTCVYKVY